MLSAAIGACEQSIFTVQRDRADGTLDGIVVELDAAIVDKARQALPARQCVSDGLGELALLTDQAEFGAQPRFECIDQQSAFLLADIASLVGGTAAALLRDRIEPGHMLERFAGDRRRTRGGELIELAPHMRPAKRKLDVVTFSQFAIAGVAVDLQDADEAIEMGDRAIGFAVRCVEIDDTGWISATPRPIVGSIGPELAGFGATAAGIEHRRRGLVGEQPG